LYSLRKIAVRIGRKLIPYITPDNIRLPLYYCLHLLGGDYENELRKLDYIILDRKVAIDIGANIGFYSYKLSKYFEQVYAFEINDELTKDLIAYNAKNIKIINKGLSSRKQKCVLYIPVYNGVSLTGWASLLPGNCPDTQTHIQKGVEVMILDALHLYPVSFIKIDVEGHELEVLKGSYLTIASNRPVVLVEVKDQNISEVISFFESLEYERKDVRHVTGHPGSEENFLFYPKEVVDSIKR
jgi:FkbM family methyltransferase